MSIAPYAEYKDSRIDVIGLIPSHWALGKLRHTIDPKRPITYGIVQAGPDHPDGIPYIRPADMTDEKGIKDINNILRTSPSIAASYARSEVRKGDLVCSIGPSFGKVMLVPEKLSGANLTQGTARVAISHNFEPIYFFWILRSRSTFAQWEREVGGATFRALNLEPLANTLVPIPSLQEQKAIAQFLNHETAKIDALIEEQQRLIELLKEKRQAVITNAVTKGLDPSAPMKDSGVEWLGQVPAHWEVQRIKDQLQTTSGGTPKSDQENYYTDEADGIPWIRTTDLDNDILTSTPIFITEEAVKATACSLLPCDSVLVAMYGGDGTVGKNALLKFPATVNQAVCGLLPTNQIDPLFLWRYIQFYRPYWMVYAESSRKDPNISQEIIQNAPLVLPPLEEQRRISNFLNAEIPKLDDLLTVASNAIQLLSERRNALISAAVTGKIDVRGLLSDDTEAA